MSYRSGGHIRFVYRLRIRGRKQFGVRDPSSRPTQHVGATVLFLLLVFTGGCRSAGASRVWITPPASDETILAGFDRVLVAGFLTDRRSDMDVNGETVRFLRMELRSKTPLRVVENEPLTLGSLSVPHDPGAAVWEHRSSPPPDKGRPTRRQHTEEAVFMNAPFWKKVGEEYGNPLVLTGTVVFRPPTELRLRLTLISGKTGAILDSTNLQARMPSRRSHPEALTRHQQLIEKMMPSILAWLGQQTGQIRVLLK